VLRRLALVIVFTIVSAPEMSLLCKSWCVNRDAAAASCQHREGPLARVTHDRSCSEDALDVKNVLKQDLRSVPEPASDGPYGSPPLGLWLGQHDQIGNVDHPPSNLFVEYLRSAILRI
jgi:hypothetical protein